MNDKFSIDFNSQYFSRNDRNEKMITNKLGKWLAIIKRDGSDWLETAVVFFPSLPQTDKALKGVKVMVKFTCSDDDYYSFDEQAWQPLNFPYFKTYSEVRAFSQDFFNFSAKFEIDTLSLQTSAPPSFEESLASYGKKLLEGENFADVSITTMKDGNESEIKANKVILSRSPVLAFILNCNDVAASKGTLCIKEMKHEVLEEMIRYMYTDEVPKLNEMAYDLLIAAKKYLLPGLVKLCSMHLQSNLTNENSIEILMTADKLEVSDLKEKAINYIIENRAQIFATEQWKELMTQNFELGMEIVRRL